MLEIVSSKVYGVNNHVLARIKGKGVVGMTTCFKTIHNDFIACRSNNFALAKTGFDMLLSLQSVEKFATVAWGNKLDCLMRETKLSSLL